MNVFFDLVWIYPNEVTDGLKCPLLTAKILLGLVIVNSAPALPVVAISFPHRIDVWGRLCTHFETVKVIGYEVSRRVDHSILQTCM
jgi:hypothetical protein